MRDYSFKTEQRLVESGQNISGVLFNLCEEASARDSILEFVRSLPEQDIPAIGFIETPRGEVMLKLTETFGGTDAEYDATILSDGTLRVLSIAAAVLAAAENSLVVIEEIDNGVHPSRAEQLLSSISRIAKSRGLRVLISSHNPALLDALPDDAIPDVVFCYRSPQDGSSRLTSLRDVPDYPELIAQGSIGHLMTRGVIERFVKTRPAPEERMRRSLDWVRAMRKETA
jgi:predicted ATPase